MDPDNTIPNECNPICRMVKLLGKLSLEERRILANLITDWKVEDQRQYPRITCSIVTDCMAVNQLFRDTIENISAGGAYISTKRHLPLNMRIHQSFFIPNTEILIQSNSQIIWTGSEGYGVRFEIIESKN